MDDSVSLFVQGVILPDIDEDGCTFEAGGGTLLSPGVADVETDLVLSDNVNYRVVLSVGNQLQRRAVSGRAETNGVQIQRVEVTLRDLGGVPLALGGLPNPFSVPATGFIPPAADLNSPSFGPVSAVVIPSRYATEIADTFTRDASGELVPFTLIVGIKLFGETQGDISIELEEWDWPVSICGGCLFACAAPGTDPVGVCNPGQDDLAVLPSGSLGCP